LIQQPKSQLRKVLENEIVRLRAVEPEDLDRLYDWENDPQLWAVGNARNPYSRFVLKQYILDSDRDIYETHQLRLMMVNIKTGETIGTVDLFDFDIHHSRIALGLFVDAAFQGQGYAKAALSAVEDYVFNFLKINQLYCHIAETNIASRRMFENAGYEVNGILKNWIKTKNGFDNIIVFQRFRSSISK
jgi:diamine N-acetyltransferase